MLQIHCQTHAIHLSGFEGEEETKKASGITGGFRCESAVCGKLGLGLDFGGLVGGVDRLVSGRLSLLGLGYLASSGGRCSSLTSLGVFVILTVNAEVVESTGHALTKFRLVSRLLSSAGLRSGSRVASLLSTTSGISTTSRVSSAGLTGSFLAGAGSDELLGFLNILFVGGG